MGIYVWGTGCGAADLLEKGLDVERITGFVDSFPSGEHFLGKPVLKPEELDKNDCQLLIVTTRHANAVAKRCEELGIPAENCLFLKNAVTLSNRNAACTAAGKLLGETLVKQLCQAYRMISEPASLHQPGLPEEALEGDYVRLATLELLCRRLRNVPGETAELGVYKGFFARCIHGLLPERKLYLFDSFQGFGETAGASDAFQAAHRNTAIKNVMETMPHPENVTIKPGFFPASLEGLEERFCLVSLDVDFYETTLEGLRYFWPRLNPGGYLLLHDWGSPKLPGVAKALADYETELGTGLPAVPLCDSQGSLVLCKG